MAYRLASPYGRLLVWHSYDLLFAFLPRLCRAKQLLEKKRLERAREEEDKVRNEERERRRRGQEMAKLQQSKEEREKKELGNSYKKQKEEERLAREKVRANIERDRFVF